MGRKLAIILLMCLSHSAWAQKDNFKKLEKLHEKGNADKLYKLSSKSIKEHKKSPEPYYYMALTYQFKYEKNHKKSDLDKAVQYLSKGSKLDKEKNAFSEMNEKFIPMKDSIYNLAHIIYNKDREKSKIYFTHLATFFSDTTEEYMVLYNIKKIEKTSTTLEYDKIEKIDRLEIIKTAEKLIGTPYKYGGEDTTGFDCSGFVKYVYKKAGKELPHNAHMMSKLGNEIPIEEAKHGDLVLFGYKTSDSYRTTHAGMVYNVGNNFTVIHCVSKGVHITESDWSYWKDKVLFVRNVLD